MRSVSPRLVDAADRLAVVISGACLIHCLAVPLVFALLPVLATFIYVPEALHLWLVIIAVPVSGYALLVGRGGDGQHRPIILGTSGMVLLLIGATALTATLETLATVVGGLLLAAAHMLTWRCRHSG